MGDEFQDFPIPPLDELMEHLLWLARVTNPDCAWAGISVNTERLDDAERQRYLADTGQRYGVPTADPLATGLAPIADRLLELVP